MDITTGFLIYASLFRLAVIAAGVASIVLGYFLFARGVMPGGGTHAEARAGDIRLTLKNAAPGTVFALFGAAVIVVMLIQGSPELLIEDVSQLAASTERSDQAVKRRVQLKGPGDEAPAEARDRYNAAFQQGLRHQEAGEVAPAIAAYGRALSESDVSLRHAASALNQLAWLYREPGLTDEALGLARVAVAADGNQAAYRDTLALTLLERGEPEEAARHAERAVALNPDDPAYRQTLERVRAARADQRSPGD